MICEHTDRLYYDDPALVLFKATIAAVRDDRNTHFVALDQTAFYPTSGGQPHDIGTLTPDHGMTATVHDVVDDDGVVWHAIDRPLAVGMSVQGRIDAARRFDLRQQHSAQHVLSASLAARCGAETRSVHLGLDVSTIDIDRDLPAGALADAERDANAVVFEDRAVTVRYVDADVANTLGLRKRTERAGTVRLVDINDHDLSACGGTHVTRTGQIGLITIRGTERFRGGLRVTFVCGWRALRSCTSTRDLLDEAARLLSTSPDDVPAAVARLQDDARSARKATDAMCRRLADLEADVLSRQFETVGPLQLLVGHVPDADPATLRRLATQLITTPTRVVVLVGGPSPHGLVIGRSADLQDVDAGALARHVTGAFGGKAGGRSDLAQGGGLECTTQELRVSIRRALERL